MKTEIYNLLVVTDKGNMACQHISCFGFVPKDFIEVFQEKYPDRKVKEIRVMAKESFGKSKLLEQLLKRKH